MDKNLLRESILREMRLSFSRSGGAGGQNVNKVNSKVTLTLPFDLLEGLSEGEMSQVRGKLAGRINEKGELIIQAEEDRSQLRNRAIAVERLFSLICDSAIIPRKRRPTRPGKAAREERLSHKRKRKEVKHLRKPVTRDRFD
ncbi:MAG: aminoacyl-tRNA hydrolase [Spirochaetales bacterium]|nr:aminoacyl-tRNA hydrolase [Spirochaetales bacterium]